VAETARKIENEIFLEKRISIFDVFRCFLKTLGNSWKRFLGFVIAIKTLTRKEHLGKLWGE
jgi:hypothetical protein